MAFWPDACEEGLLVSILVLKSRLANVAFGLLCGHDKNEGYKAIRIQNLPVYPLSSIIPMLHQLFSERWDPKQNLLHSHLRKVARHLDASYSGSIFDTTENGLHPRGIF